MGHINNACFRKKKSQLNYLDIRGIMERRLVLLKKGLLMDMYIRKLITEWQDEWEESELDRAMIDREIKTMEWKLDKYNVPPLGDIPTRWDNGSFRILVCQMSGCSGREIREQTIAITERLRG